MAKRRHPPEWYEEICLRYLENHESIIHMSRLYGVDKASIKFYVKQYKEYGISAFTQKEGNKKYSAEFKKKCVEAYMNGEGSLGYLAVKFGLPTTSSFRKWIKKYNANMELKDYDPHGEIYMAEARRKTTKEERLEIVQYCLNHGKDYKNTALKFDVSYGQVFSWVKGYCENGEDALNDNRGRRKKDAELSEVERLRRENVRLKRLLKEEEMTVELLKKVKEFERM